MNYSDCMNRKLKTLQHVRIKVCVQLISAAFEHCVLCIREIYALENAVFNIAVYGVYKPYISSIRNTECSNAHEINCTVGGQSNTFEFTMVPCITTCDHGRHPQLRGAVDHYLTSGRPQFMVIT